MKKKKTKNNKLKKQVRKKTQDKLPNFPRSTWGGKTDQFYDVRQKELGNYFFLSNKKKNLQY